MKKVRTALIKEKINQNWNVYVIVKSELWNKAVTCDEGNITLGGN